MTGPATSTTRAIGEELNALGSLRVMQAVYYEVLNWHFVTACELQRGVARRRRLAGLSALAPGPAPLFPVGCHGQLHDVPGMRVVQHVPLPLALADEARELRLPQVPPVTAARAGAAGPSRPAQPIVQVLASFPANFLFPLITAVLLATGWP